MRVSSISPVFLGAALLAVACSKPSDSVKDQESRRDVRLIEEPSTDKQTVSDLEAGKPPHAPLPEARSRSANLPAAEPVAAPAPNHAAMMAELEPEATMKVVTTIETPAPVSETSLPFIRGAGMQADSTPEHWNYGGGSRGPMILIRGGMGTDRDDCKIHGMGGIAINRITPPVRGAGGNRRNFSGGGGTVRIR